MSYLLVDKLTTELTHEIRLTSSERVQVAALCPYLLSYNLPSGTFTLSVLSGVATIFSQNFTALNITSENYAHVFHPIIPTNLLMLESGIYTIKLSASGYTPSESSYLGWIKQHENLQNELEYIPINDTYNPYAIRIKVFK